MSRYRVFALSVGAVLTAAGMLGAASVITGAIARPMPTGRSGPLSALAVAIAPDRFDVHPGDAVTMFVTVVNTGSEALTDARLASSLDGIATEANTPDGCEGRTIGRLAAGRRMRFACAVEAPAAAFRFGAAVTARAGGRPIRDRATLAVGADRARLTASIDVVSGHSRPGGAVVLRVRVRNTGSVPIERLSTLDSAFPGCSVASLGTLAPRTETSYGCLGTAPLDDAPTAIVAWGYAGPAQVRAISDVEVVDVVHPALVVTGERSRRRTELTVTNVGDTPLAGVRTEAPSAPDCARGSLGTLAAGESASVRCSPGSSGGGTITAVGVATGADAEPAAEPFDPAEPAGGPGSSRTDPPGGPGGGRRSGVQRPTDEIADVVEVRPTAEAGLTVTQRVSKDSALAGTPVTYTISVRNTGTVPLHRVVLRDPLLPGCNGKVFGSLKPRRRASVTCTAPAPADDVSHVAIAVGETSDREPVSGVSDAAALDVVHPALAVRVVAQPSDPYPREPVTWTLTVQNTGDVAVRRVAVRSTVGDCRDRLGTLRPGGPPRTVTCEMPAGSSSVTNVMTVTGSPSAGGDITEIAAATAYVREAGGPGGAGVPTSPPSLPTSPRPSPIERDAPAPSASPSTSSDASPSPDPSPSELPPATPSPAASQAQPRRSRGRRR